MTEKKDLYSMLPEELEEYFISLGEPKFRAKQVFPRLAAGATVEIQHRNGGIHDPPRACGGRIQHQIAEANPDRVYRHHADDVEI